MHRSHRHHVWMPSFGGDGLPVAPKMDGQAVTLIVNAHASKPLIHLALACTKVSGQAFDVDGTAVLEGGDDRPEFHAQGGVIGTKFGIRISLAAA